jgi:uncharacterized protein HemY
MRLLLLLLAAMAIAAILAFYPDIAQHDVRFEAFGWVLELNQFVFILILLLLLIIFWLARKILLGLISGPSHLWQRLTSGKYQRREENLREGISQLIDQRHDFGVKAFSKAKGVIPDWAMDLIRIFTIPVHELSLARVRGDRLKTSLCARLATEPQTVLDPEKRREFLNAWLEASPNSPLALNRLCLLAEEEEDWPTALPLLEEQWKGTDGEDSGVRKRLVNAYLAMALREPGEQLNWIRKAEKIDPESGQVVLALGRAYISNDDRVAARRLWGNFLKRHDDFQIAQSLLDITEDPMRAYRKMESESASTMPASRQWLRAQFAHAAGLTGLANRHMQRLIEQHPSKLAWQTLGKWHAESREWEEAAKCYAKALLTDNRQN